MSFIWPDFRPLLIVAHRTIAALRVLRYPGRRAAAPPSSVMKAPVSTRTWTFLPPRGSVCSSVRTIVTGCPSRKIKCGHTDDAIHRGQAVAGYVQLRAQGAG